MILLGFRTKITSHLVKSLLKNALFLNSLTFSLNSLILRDTPPTQGGGGWDFGVPLKTKIFKEISPMSIQSSIPVYETLRSLPRSDFKAQAPTKGNFGDFVEL